ncbi:MAG TPA: tRNA (cytidine(56)-2'-O)-methyltransferase [Thermoplasmata archaeon]
MITVLRLGHRPGRDRRVTTHVALTARAFGADAVLVSTKDPRLERTVRDVVRRFGGSFRVETGVPWRRVLRDWAGTTVQLTMYGMELYESLPRISTDDVLVVVGAEKVPGDVYRLVDANVAVGNQPHSEVAALAVFLDRLLGGAALHREFGGRLRIRPGSKGRTLESGR